MPAYWRLAKTDWERALFKNQLLKKQAKKNKKRRKATKKMHQRLRAR